MNKLLVLALVVLLLGISWRYLRDEKWKEQKKEFVRRFCQLHHLVGGLPILHGDIVQTTFWHGGVPTVRTTCELEDYVSKFGVDRVTLRQIEQEMFRYLKQHALRVRDMSNCIKYEFYGYIGPDGTIQFDFRQPLPSFIDQPLSRRLVLFSIMVERNRTVMDADPYQKGK